MAAFYGDAVGFQSAPAIYSMKMETNDWNLLRQYAEQHSQEAFATLVSPHQESQTRTRDIRTLSVTIRVISVAAF